MMSPTAQGGRPRPLTDRHGLVEELLRSAERDSKGRLHRPDDRPAPDVPAPVRRPGHWTAGLVTDVTHMRRAVHQFDDLHFSVDALLTVAGEARQADTQLWGSEVKAGRSIDLVALAWRVDSLSPGAYNVSDTLQLVPVPTRGSGLPSPREFVIQDEFAAAPVILFAGGNLEAALAAHGVHGHRLLASRAAASLHTAWLTTVALGGYGCLFGGVVDAAVRAATGADGHRRSLVIGAALGLPGSA